MMRSVLITCSCLMVYGTAGRPTPCDSPKQWEGFVYKADKSRLVDTFMRTSYDEYNKRVRITEDEGPENHVTLFLYNEGLMYELNEDTGECTVSSLSSEEFTPYQIPESARFAYYDSVASSRTWEGEQDGDRNIIRVSNSLDPDEIPSNSYNQSFLNSHEE